MNVFLGIDTSAYTTSLALVSEDGSLIADQRRLLKVPEGGRGLRQSEAHFSHIRNLPILMEESAPLLSNNHLAGIGVSDRPRPQDDSYMPVFAAGLSVAQCLALAINTPLYRFSHQEGHVEAALYGTEYREPVFIAVHFSGGTSEILLVKREKGRYEIEMLMGTTDLNAGQLVDRIGVAMGLPFPAGPKLEEMARETREWSIPSSVSERGRISFSGAETGAYRLLEVGVPYEAVAFLVFKCIANTVEKSLRIAVAKTGVNNIVLAGGVMANHIIRQRLLNRFKGSRISLFWAPVEFSSDNAVGTSMLARNIHIRNESVE